MDVKKATAQRMLFKTKIGYAELRFYQIQPNFVVCLFCE